MNKLLFLLMMLAAAASVVAAPVRNMPVKRVQPKGDTLYCFVSGDEFFHRLHDAADYTIVQNAATGDYVYAAISEGKLVPTTLIPGVDDPAVAGLKPGLMPDAKELKRLHAAWEIPAQYQEPAPKTAISVGNMNNVVIFIRFSDETSFSSTSFSSISSLFNDSTAGNSSMYNYFEQSSYGNLHVRTHFYPTTTSSTVLSYQDSHTRAYFRPYSATNTVGYSTDSARRAREFQLLEDAVTWINTNSPVPTSLNIDMNNDGRVDNVVFIVSGTYTGWNDLLWPHKWSLYDRYVYINNKRVYTFNLQLVNSGSHYFSVSTLCHEMVHTLGCPDIYNYYNYTSISPAGTWDIMNSNANPPQQTNSMFKYIYLDWLDSIPQLTDTGTYTMQSLATGPNHAYKIASSDRQQWYILEYRNWTDTFDSSIPNRGMLIWRYNTSTDASNSSFDFSTTPHELWLFRPGSHDDTTSGNISQASFGVGGRNSFYYGSGSTNYPFLCDGTVDTTFRITNIQLSADYSSVSFTFTPTVTNPCSGPISTYPVNEGFENGDEGCWSVVTLSPGNDGRIGVYPNSSDAPTHAGSYQFRFSSYASASDYNQYLISPQLSHTNPLAMSFYYRKSNTANEHFIVKYSTTGNNVTDFTNTLVNTFATSTSWQKCDVTLPQDARYVAINYCSNYLYYLYIDDIAILDTLNVTHDTTYVHVTDTIYTWTRDTLSLTIHDTVYHHTEIFLCDTIHDTLYLYDTIYNNIVRLRVESADSMAGVGVGSGVYCLGAQAQIAALPRNEGSYFSHWMDGNTDNPRNVTATMDSTFVAYFISNLAKDGPMGVVHDTLYQRDTVYVNRHVTDTIFHYQTIHIYDTIFTELPPFHDTIWERVTVEVAYSDWVTLSVTSSNPDMGVATGSGSYPSHAAVEACAIPYAGYRFAGWNDGNTDNPRTLYADGTLSIVALFESDGQQSITDVEPRSSRVFTQGSTLVVEAQDGQQVRVYNTLGQLVAQQMLPSTGDVVRFDNLPAGFYAVQIDGMPAQKAVVIR